MKHLCPLSALALLCALLPASAQTFTASVSGSSLNLGVDCSTSTPCNEPIGNQTVQYTFPTQVTVPSGSSASDMAYIYLDALNPSVVTVGTSALALTCGAGATCRTGISSIPPNAKPLYRWPIVWGQFSAYDPSFDLRSQGSAQPVLAQPGVIITQQSGQIQASPDFSVLANATTTTPAPTPTPAQPTQTSPCPTSTSVPVTAPTVTNNAPTLWFQIVNTHSNLCITGQSDGTLAQVACSATNANQLFSMIPEFDSTGALTGYQLLNQGMHQSADVWGFSAANGTTVGLWPFKNSSNELFNLVPNPAGGMSLVAKFSGSCVDVPGSSTTAGTKIQQYSCNNTAAQAFKVSIAQVK